MAFSTEEILEEFVGIAHRYSAPTGHREWLDGDGFGVFSTVRNRPPDVFRRAQQRSSYARLRADPEWREEKRKKNREHERRRRDRLKVAPDDVKAAERLYKAEKQKVWLARVHADPVRLAAFREKNKARAKTDYARKLARRQAKR